ncbi:hypothetical protein GQ600_17444 [Phytophthora cactorum]|nr:hypothetical protein GQ600_17444 [Phytophthora cactorum]
MKTMESDMAALELDIDAAFETKVEIGGGNSSSSEEVSSSSEQMSLAPPPLNTIDDDDDITSQLLSMLAEEMSQRSASETSRPLVPAPQASATVRRWHWPRPPTSSSARRTATRSNAHITERLYDADADAAFAVVYGSLITVCRCGDDYHCVGDARGAEGAYRVSARAVQPPAGPVGGQDGEREGRNSQGPVQPHEEVLELSRLRDRLWMENTQLHEQFEDREKISFRFQRLFDVNYQLMDHSIAAPIEEENQDRRDSITTALIIMTRIPHPNDSGCLIICKGLRREEHTLHVEFSEAIALQKKKEWRQSMYWINIEEVPVDDNNNSEEVCEENQEKKLKVVHGGIMNNMGDPTMVTSESQLSPQELHRRERNRSKVRRSYYRKIVETLEDEYERLLQTQESRAAFHAAQALNETLNETDTQSLLDMTLEPLEELQSLGELEAIEPLPLVAVDEPPAGREKRLLQLARARKALYEENESLRDRKMNFAKAYGSLQHLVDVHAEDDDENSTMSKRTQLMVWRKFKIDECFEINRVAASIYSRASKRRRASLYSYTDWTPRDSRTILLRSRWSGKLKCGKTTSAGKITRVVLIFGVWLLTFVLRLLLFRILLEDEEGGCRMSYGGLVLVEHPWEQFWLCEVLLLALRWESSVVAPLFSLRCN